MICRVRNRAHIVWLGCPCRLRLGGHAVSRLASSRWPVSLLITGLDLLAAISGGALAEGERPVSDPGVLSIGQPDQIRGIPRAPRPAYGAAEPLNLNQYLGD